MRTPLIAGNWKMYKTAPEAAAYASQFLPLVAELANVEIALCPPATDLKTLADALGGSQVALGAQDLFWKEEGAYTGMIAPRMLVDLCCRYAIVGHSERRGRFGKADPDLTLEAMAVFGDNDETVNRKVRAAVAAGLTPIMCCGEMLSERDAGQTEQVVRRQVELGTQGLHPEQVAGMVIAYEPVWAIGTNRICKPEDANAVISMIRRLVQGRFGEAAARQVRLQYGGSVKSANVRDQMLQPEIDGALVGGSSLDPAEFAAICRLAAEAARARAC